jgi:hypothetical protein
MRLKIKEMGIGLFLFVILLLVLPAVPLIPMWIIWAPATFWQVFALAVLSVILYFIYLVIEFFVLVVIT